MKLLYLLLSFYIGLIALTGCSTTTPRESTTTLSLVNTPPLVKAPKTPWAVALFTKSQHPSEHYIVIAKESVSKFNAGGIKRQEAIIKDMLRNQAASVGGDAVININRDGKVVTGEIVSFV